jgi:hypothetical protein
MTPLIAPLGLGSLALLVVLGSGGVRTPVPQANTVNPTGAAVKAFLDNVQAYIKVRARAENKVRKLDETADPAKIQAREVAFGEAIRAERASAKRGDVFGPVEALFRKTVREDSRKRGARDRKALLAELPPGLMPKVNAVYPPTVPLATFPPALIEQLTPLPEQLEYRFMGRHLILRDVKANVIVDYIPDILPRAT